MHVSISITPYPSPLSLLNFGVQVGCFEGSWSCPTSKFMPFLILFGHCSCHCAHTQCRNGDNANSGWPDHKRGQEKELGYWDCRWDEVEASPRTSPSIPGGLGVSPGDWFQACLQLGQPYYIPFQNLMERSAGAGELECCECEPVEGENVSVAFQFKARLQIPAPPWASRPPLPHL